MKRLFISACLVFTACVSVSAASPFSLKNADFVEYADNYTRGTDGLFSVFVVNTVDEGASLVLSIPGRDSLYNCKWFSFSESAEELTELTSDISTVKNESSLTNFSVGKGYACQFENADGENTQVCVWLTKYEPITSASWGKDEFYCDVLPLHISPVMYYRQFKGFLTAIDRTEDVKYNVFEMDNGALTEVRTEQLVGDSVLRVPEVPTVDTRFEFTNADFNTTFLSDTFFTNAVNAFPEILVQDKAPNESDAKNLPKRGDEVVLYFGSDGDFRSSGPLSLTFKANISPKVNDMEWIFASDSLFEKNRKVVPKNARAIQGDNYNIYNYELLNTAGTHWVKLVAKNVESECEYETVAKFEIASSALYIPNAFTPGGDNPEFLVAYKSIESFECRIYNQSGRKVFDSSNINQGWDGSYHGREMPTGVYFYVIKARGTDGVEYNKKGTINLLRSTK